MGVRDERTQDLFLLEQIGEPTEDGQVRKVAGDIRAYVDGVVYTLINVNESQHKILRHLIHFLESGPGDGFAAGPYYSETLPAGDPFPTSETWYENATKAKKIVAWSCTYNANKTFATETWTVYKADGASKAAEAVDSISYSGVFETSRTRTVTVW